MPDSFSFHISADQSRLIRNWWHKVKAVYFTPDDECFEYPGSIEYSFIPTGVGSVITVRDTHSGEMMEVTDYENW